MNDYRYNAFPFSFHNNHVTDWFCLSGIYHIYYGANSCIRQDYLIYCTVENLQRWDHLMFKEYD